MGGLRTSVWRHERSDLLPVMTRTGPLNSGAVAGKLPKVRNSPRVAGILCASEYSSAERSLPAGAKKAYRDFISAFTYVEVQQAMD